MRAVRIHQHGDASVLRLEDVPDPKPDRGWALVRVRACALNHLDIWIRIGLPGIQIPLPHILGSDLAGEIVDPGSADLKPGTRILVAPGIGCGRCAACSSGTDNFCRQYTLVGYMVDGGYAELAAVPAANLIPIPATMSFTEAAAVPLVFLTAWHMLVARAGLRPGEDVLIQGAGSGVGSAAIQIAKLLGARVIATSGAARKLELAQQLGADHVLSYREQDIASEVRRLTGKKGVDVVFEHVGAATWDGSVASLAQGGRLVTCGATSGAKVELDIRHLFGRQLVLAGSYMGGRGELHKVLQFVFDGRLKPVIDRTFPLAEAAAAHRHLESQQQFGKVLLQIS
jgi:NADPH:quinone reductase-like Zn-dependent oxidoreductase